MVCDQVCFVFLPSREYNLVMLVCVAILLCNIVLPAAAQYRSCLDERLEAQAEYARILSESDLLSYFYVPECDNVTGHWSPLQQDSNNMRWCVNTHTGDVISQKSDRLTSCEGCLVSRLVIMLNIQRAETAGARVNNVYFPDCQETYPEYYEEKQCWNGYFNACWCVDPRTGDATSFPTENGVTCETDRRNNMRPTWCRVVASLTKSYYSVYQTVRRWRHGEEGPTVKPDVTMEVVCDQEGMFAEEQCLGEDCWCVDTGDGRVERECSRHRTKRSLYSLCQDNRVQQLEAYYEFVVMGVMLEHFTIPMCTALGGWDTMQCSNQTVAGEKSCWCVDQYTGTQTTGASQTLKSCDSCRAHILKETQAGIESYTSCDETGRYYTAIQCNQHGHCRCVDHVTGRTLHRTHHGDVTGEDCERYDNQYNLKTRNSVV